MRKFESWARLEYWRISIPECGGSNPPQFSQYITNASHMKVAQKPRDRSAASGDLMKTLLGRVYLANALSCVHLQGETVSCG
jgi:hypothetical protein